MTESRLIKRYGAYYHGWCLAFGEHESDFDQERPLNWLYGEEKVGWILAPELHRKLQHELLGKQPDIPELILSSHRIGTHHNQFQLMPATEAKGIQALREMCHSGDDVHMYLCSHFVYSPRTRIITFSLKAPTLIMYKEMSSLKLVIE